jgi:mannose-6-phosphate isomerase-like protein (cupin superfamily)
MVAPETTYARRRGRMADGYDLMGIEDFEAMDGSGECSWHLARKGLGISAFGMNVVDIGPGGQIPEHTEEERDHEEVFIVLEGDAVVVVDGVESPAPKGTFLRVSPAVRRQIRNQGGDSARVLIISAPRSSGYEPMGWG